MGSNYPAYIRVPSINTNNIYLDVHSNGSITIEGSIKNVAMALVKYIVKETRGGAIGVELNRTIKASCRKHAPYTLEWVSKQSEPPPFWEDLKKEYERIWRLKAFI